MRKRAITAACLVLVLALLLGTPPVFAEGDNNTYRWSGSQGSQGSDAEGNTYRNQYRERFQTILANQETIAQLRLQVRQEALRLREQIRRLRAEPGRIDEEKLALIREGLRLINASRRELGQSLGLVRQHALRFRLHRLQRNFSAGLEDLDAIITVQQNRIRLLNRLLGDMQGLLARL